MMTRSIRVSPMPPIKKTPTKTQTWCPMRRLMTTMTLLCASVQKRQPRRVMVLMGSELLILSTRTMMTRSIRASQMPPIRRTPTKTQTWCPMRRLMTTMTLLCSSRQKKTAKKGDGFDGFGAPDPFNQNDDDEVDQGEPNAPDKEDPNEDANMVSDAEANEDDDSFVQLASKKTRKKGDGFDGFGAPDPFNQNDDDEVDQGEPNAPAKEDPNEDANMVSDAEANE